MLLDVACIADGYLAAAAPASESRGMASYFPDLRHEEGFALVRVAVDDPTLASRLLAQGTHEQHFDDGYSAANALATYAADRGIDLGA